MRRPDALSEAIASGPLSFLAFLLPGCAYIVAAKLWGLPAALVTFVPVLLMGAYAGSMLWLRGLAFRDDQAGDNVYYLGFLYTLTSLGTSLYQFDAGDAGDAIVRNFGVAIASTIAGVAGRVMFNQMRRDPVEVERTARLELAESARRVRRELDGTVVEMALFRRQMQQMVEEGLRETQARFAGAWQGLDAAVMAAGARTAETVGGAAGRAAGALDGHAEAVRRDAEATASAQADLRRALHGLSGRLDGVRTPDAVFAAAIRPAVDALSEASAALAAAAPRVETQVAPQVAPAVPVIEPVLEPVTPAIPERAPGAIVGAVSGDAPGDVAGDGPRSGPGPEARPAPPAPPRPRAILLPAPEAEPARPAGGAA